MFRKIKLKIFLTSLLMIAQMGHAQGLSFSVSYEPFLLKQFNPASQNTYESGTSVGSSSIQEENNLLFHLLSLRWHLARDVNNGKNEVGIEIGISASPEPIRSTWIIPALSGFSGIVIVPTNIGGDSASANEDYWRGRTVDVAIDSIERYLLEDTSLVYAPLNLYLGGKRPIARKFYVDWKLATGLSLFYLSAERQRLSGSPTPRFTAIQHSMIHFSKTLGGEVGASYEVSENFLTFLNLSANAVQDISSFQQSESGLVEGYRFDGLRYNAKLGVSWKL